VASKVANRWKQNITDNSQCLTIVKLYFPHIFPATKYSITKNKKQNKKDIRKYVEQKQDYQTHKASGISSSVGGHKLLLSKGHCSKIKGKGRGESKKK
jgi:hypothetical protein